MARKRSRSQSNKEPTYDGGGSSVRAINTWDDVDHDSEDEFHAERDQVLLGKEGYSRRRDSSDEEDEEVFGLEGVSDDSDDSQQEDAEEEEEEEEDDDDNNNDMEEDDTAWGRKRTSYYNADEASDEEDAKEEEKEALRLQKKQLNAMEEDDFMDEFDDSFGKAGDNFSSKVSLEKDVSEDRKLVDSVNQDLDLISLGSNVATETIKKDITSKLTKAQTLKLLQNESPELIELLSEFKEKLEVKDELEPIIHLAKEKGIDSSMSKAMALLEAKYQLLLNYLLNTSFYFLLKSSGAPDIKEHPVIDILVSLKTNLEKVEQLEEKLHQDLEDFVELLHSNLLDSENEQEEEEEEEDEDADEQDISIEKPSLVDDMAEEDEDEDISDEQSEESEKEASFEDDFAKVNKELSTKLRKRKKADNDFGDLDIQDIESQSTKKRSLRDYVAKINQSSNKRDIRNKFAGDTDIPYKSRDNRFTKTLPKNIGGGDDDDMADLGVDDSGEDDYYEEVKEALGKKRQEKAEQAAAAQVRETEWVDDTIEDGDKRQINYAILKNKGLTPRRKKENRNPRVKHRNKFEKAKKRIKSIKAIASGPEGVYSGEKTGIKTKLAKSVKLG
ncbi:hypothetical protein K493DRAFT_65015 [Basidiobolus meristosporus CBS 931.73]|uniref:Sas10 C-terminal domain-containing protein n=1 Tax=Basidiobolus meristosporus CBS 931.73 TaxID=1314790 RepID=A0A1Y1Z0F0_9FUNG|nr:hypothetical protein K493DRAFT_65015 [Basidiobolus meristosporus CBS 931.73]|eukprot:ORY03783.1 hypothetical protein K493DRAFT_65015 [Basidiobolus meristosporus CBS 931.73]